MNVVSNDVVSNEHGLEWMVSNECGLKWKSLKCRSLKLIGLNCLHTVYVSCTTGFKNLVRTVNSERFER